MECSALMVIMDAGSEKFMSVDMNIMDGVMPQNNSKDIMRVVDICNKSKIDESVMFVDMYGIITDNKVEMWEIEDES